jgi:hypothetical protein
VDRALACRKAAARELPGRVRFESVAGEGVVVRLRSDPILPFAIVRNAKAYLAMDATGESGETLLRVCFRYRGSRRFLRLSISI